MNHVGKQNRVCDYIILKWRIIISPYKTKHNFQAFPIIIIDIVRADIYVCPKNDFSDVSNDIGATGRSPLQVFFRHRMFPNIRCLFVGRALFVPGEFHRTRCFPDIGCLADIRCLTKMNHVGKQNRVCDYIILKWRIIISPYKTKHNFQAFPIIIIDIVRAKLCVCPKNDVSEVPNDVGATYYRPYQGFQTSDVLKTSDVFL